MKSFPAPERRLAGARPLSPPLFIHGLWRRSLPSQVLGAGFDMVRVRMEHLQDRPRYPTPSAGVNTVGTPRKGRGAPIGPTEGFPEKGKWRRPESSFPSPTPTS